MTNFLHSYGLKEYNPEDWTTAREIMDHMKQNMWSEMSKNERDAARAHHVKYCGPRK